VCSSDLSNVGANVTITIEGSEDSRLNHLKTKGTVTLGDVSIYGKVKKLTAATVSDGATWELIGGVSSSVTVGALTNVDVTTGQLGKWKMGAFTGGSLTADAFKSFYASGAVTGDITAQLGDASKITVRSGDLDGDVTVLGTIKTLKVAGNLDGAVTVTNGDLLTVKVTGNLTSAVEATYGISKSVTVTGNFTGSFRTAEGIKKFTSSGFSGLLSTDGDLSKLTVKGAMTGRARAGGTIKSATFASMNGALVTAGSDFKTAKIKGDMTDSQLFAGFDPGDAGYSVGETGNVEIDAFGSPTANQVDSVLGGSIKKVTVSGTMTDSTISAAVGPGEDGYCGTSDDIVLGIGYVTRVKVTGAIIGSGNSSGVFAANEISKVYHWNKHPFVSNGTAHTGKIGRAHV